MTEVSTKPTSLKSAQTSVQTKPIPALIQFELQSDDIEEFHSDYSSQVYDKEVSIISSETEKRKKEIRDKVNDYLNYRKSMGIPNKPKKMNFGVEEDEFDGDILDQLGLIEG